MSETLPDVRILLDRLEPMLSRIADRQDTLAREFDGRFAKVELRRDKIEQGPEDVAQRLERVELRVEQVAQRFGPLGRRVEKLQDGQGRLIADVAELKGRVAQLPTALHLLGVVLAVRVAGGVLTHFRG